MRNKLTLLVIILLLLMAPKSFASSTNELKVKAISESTVDASKYGITNPEKKSFSVDKKISLLNGFAPEGTLVKIKHFATADLTGKKYDLLKLPANDEYIEVIEKEVIVGKLGVFDTKLNLVDGINLLQINFGVKGLEDVKIIIYVSSFQNLEKIVLK
ncbi:MAG: hypothetical protein GX219_09335 [Tissierellia bacterium]|nr:hypothetical protein [Tissierellia bacterium]